MLKGLVLFLIVPAVAELFIYHPEFMYALSVTEYWFPIPKHVDVVFNNTLIRPIRRSPDPWFDIFVSDRDARGTEPHPIALVAITSINLFAAPGFGVAAEATVQTRPVSLSQKKTPRTRRDRICCQIGCCFTYRLWWCMMRV